MLSKNKDSYLYYLLSTETVEAIVCLMMHDILNKRIICDASREKKKRIYLIAKYKRLSSSDKLIFKDILDNLSITSLFIESTAVHILEGASLIKEQLLIAINIPDNLLPPCIDINPSTSYYLQYKELTDIWYLHIKNTIANSLSIFAYNHAVPVWAKFFKIEKNCTIIDKILYIDLMCNFLQTSSIKNKEERIAKYEIQSNELKRINDSIRNIVVEKPFDGYTPFSLRDLTVYFKGMTNKLEDKELCLLLTGTECISSMGVIDITEINTNYNDEATNGSMFFKITDEDMKAKINEKLAIINI
jgi:hypothetical protein